MQQIDTYPFVARTSTRAAGRFGTRIDAMVGDTPLLNFRRVAAHLPDTVQVLAKAEWTNPSGSVKDRPALNIIRRAEERGDLHPGVTLLDSSSGNMGIAYAMIGAARGYDVKIVVPANASKERIAILRAYGVDLTLSDPAEGTDGAIRLVNEIYEADPARYFFANQYANSDNWKAHYEGTGVEVWEQTGGEVTHFVAGLGTSGTLMGTGRRLRELNPGVQIVALQPDASLHGLEGLKHMPSAIVPDIYDADLADETLAIRTEDAYEMCRRLAREEGVMVGVSSGAAMVGALRVAEGLDAGTVVTLLPDGAYKYLSERFWSEGE